MGTSNFHSIGGIDPKNVVDEYRDRALAELSDAELFDQVCPIVARPPVRGLTSFTLHAPLEVMARYGLMRLVRAVGPRVGAASDGSERRGLRPPS
jgi:hypothetical protein